MSSEELSHFEDLCQKLFSASDENVRKQAERELHPYSESIHSIPKLQYVLGSSKMPEAVFLAATSLRKLVTRHWISFSNEQRLEMRNFVLDYLAQRGTTAPNFVVNAMLQLLARITNLGWHDSSVYRETANDVKKFLEASSQHCVIGLRMLRGLVSEMNQVVDGQPLTQHRRISVSFRDTVLYSLFSLAIGLLYEVEQGKCRWANSGQENDIIDGALELALQCQSYDFIGTIADDSAEEIGTIHIPLAWRPSIEDPHLVELFLNIYMASQPPRSKTAAACLVNIASVRRTLFTSDVEREKFLSRLMSAVIQILKSQHGLNEHENYHEVCRLLHRMKINFHLSELTSTPGYAEWIDLAANLTLKSFQLWDWASKSLHYLLGLWSRLQSSVAYFKGDAATYMDRYVPLIAQGYVHSRMVLAEQVVMGVADDPLEDEDLVMNELESLPSICRSDYPKLVEHILGLMDPLLTEGEQIIRAGGAPNPNTVRVLEIKLAWLTMIIAVCVGARAVSTDDKADLLDGQLTTRVFKTLEWLKARQQAHENSTKTLELAVLQFFQRFRKTYMSEHAMNSSKAYDHLRQTIGFKDNTGVLETIVDKVATNLQNWPNCESILSKSLTLFCELATGYMPGRIVLSLQTTMFILTNHSSPQFRFLQEPTNGPFRSRYYYILGRLVFLADSSVEFDSFVQPWRAVLDQLSSVTDLNAFRQPSVRNVLMGVFRDLRGLVDATNGKKSYTRVFDFLYPKYTPIVLRAAEVWSDTPEVTTPLLKFWAEFVFNKSQRLVFDTSSPNGILLFKETSKLLVTYGTRLLQLQGTPPDAYKYKFKGIWLCCLILARSLSGSYVNFGVFGLYNDPALVHALEVTLRLVYSNPLSDFILYPKAAKAFYNLLEALSQHHLESVLLLKANFFPQIVMSLHEGIQGNDTRVSSLSACALDYVATFLFENANKDAPAAVAIKKFTQENPDLMARSLATIMNLIVHEEAPNQWALSRPLLSLIVTHERHFEDLKQQFIQSQPADTQQVVVEAFEKLMGGIRPNLDLRNREKFSHNIPNFRYHLKVGGVVAHENYPR